MQNIIEISSENTSESEKTINSQETILEDKINTELNANEAPKMFGHVESVGAKRNLKVCEL